MKADRMVLLAALWAGLAHASGVVVERFEFYRDGLLNGYALNKWGMPQVQRVGGATDDGKYLWFNDDWTAVPWAGMRFTGGSPLLLTSDWVEKGFVRFVFNGTVTRYGEPNGTLDFQVDPATAGSKYQRVRAIHIDRGRGRDEDPQSWQEVMLPLTYWTGIAAGQPLTELKIQLYYATDLAFGVDEVSLVRYDELPDWYIEMRDQPVMQPDIEWPAIAEIPMALRADLSPPTVQNGAFANADGKRTFLVNPYTRELAEFDLWGGTNPNNKPPSYDLFDPTNHGWIYNELLTAESLVRLGFNSLSVTMPPEPWYGLVGYTGDNPDSLGTLPELKGRVKVPFHVDTVNWPWTLAKPATDGFLPASSLTEGTHHWMNYRIIGAGRQLWLDLWDLYAKRYAAAGARVLTFELMNEPAYLPTSTDHFQEFATWLQARYRSLSLLNGTWGTTFSSWSAAATYQYNELPRKPVIASQFLDYDEYLANRYAGLVAEGVQTVTNHLPDALVGVQTMGNYVVNPRESVWKHLFVQHETVVFSPTGGGSWTSGGGTDAPKAILESPIASAPLSNDILLSLAGDKMIMDNECYLDGQTRTNTFNKLWRHVAVGMDGLSAFSWAKRGWVWKESLDAVLTDAEKYPYSALIPAARRTDALRGIHDFSASLQPIAADILPKPWGPEPKIALIYSWDDARRRNLEPERIDKRSAYYSALKYSHWNLKVLPTSELLSPAGLAGFDVAVLAGSVNIETNLPAVLRSFVDGGGILVVGEDSFDRDIHGKPLDTRGLAGSWMGSPLASNAGSVSILPELAPALLPGTINSPRPARSMVLADTNTLALATDSQGRPVMSRRKLGSGLVYYQGADVIGYPLAKLLWSALSDAAMQKGWGSIPDAWRAADITDAGTGQLAGNVLLSRRSYPEEGRHVLILFNRDRYAKTVRIQMSVEAGTWQVECPVGPGAQQLPASIGGTALRTTGLEVAINDESPVVLILRRAAPPVLKTKLEAEGASMVNSIIKSDVLASGGTYVDCNAGCILGWTVNAAGGTTDLEFRVKVPSASTRALGVYVNGVKVGVVTSSSISWETKAVPALLNAGNNMIELRDSEGKIELDVDSLHLVLGNEVPYTVGISMGGSGYPLLRMVDYLGQGFQLERSPDLKRWTLVTNMANTLQGEIFEYEDRAFATTTTQQFYRIFGND